MIKWLIPLQEIAWGQEPIWCIGVSPKKWEPDFRALLFCARYILCIKLIISCVKSLVQTVCVRQRLRRWWNYCEEDWHKRSTSRHLNKRSWTNFIWRSEEVTMRLVKSLLHHLLSSSIKVKSSDSSSRGRETMSFLHRICHWRTKLDQWRDSRNCWKRVMTDTQCFSCVLVLKRLLEKYSFN